MATTTQFFFQKYNFCVIIIILQLQCVHVGKAKRLSVSFLRFHRKIFKCQSHIELQGCQKLSYLNFANKEN